MNIRDIRFSLDGADARKFVSMYHYTHKCPPANFYFSAWDKHTRVGVCAYSIPRLPNIAKGYGVDLELNRLVLLDVCPKNSESRFVGWTIRWIKRNTSFSKIISYADPRFGHDGTIYRALNFKYAGRERGKGTRRIFVDGVEYYSKTAFDKWGCSGNRLKLLLPNSEVRVENMPKKHVYIFSLKQK